MKKLFKYIENLWIGHDKKPSLRRIAAIALLIDLMHNIDRSISAVHEVVKSAKCAADAIAAMGGVLANVGIILGIEAGLITALLSLTTFGPNTFGQRPQNFQVPQQPLQPIAPCPQL